MNERVSIIPAVLAASGRKRIVVVASLTRSLVNFRLELLKAMVVAGHYVVALAPDNDEEAIVKLREIGVGFQHIPMGRSGTNPVADLQTLKALYTQIRALAPDVFLAYTMKPIIYGGLAARMAKIPRRYALFTGFGFVFSDAVTGMRAGFLRRLSVRLYQSALVGCDGVFAYNDEDAADIKKYAMVAPSTPLVKVPGSGVDLTLYASSPVPSGPPVFLLIARLLREKGIGEFAAAAAVLKKKYPTARFQILGPFDPSPLGISRADMAGWTKDGAVEYLGETNDVRPYLTAATVFVLPSYYREGIPRSALEALSTGRPIITTNSPGCRETVIDGENGFLIEPRDVDALVSAQSAFLEDDQLAVTMGARSRSFAQERFDVHKVNALLLKSMGL